MPRFQIDIQEVPPDNDGPGCGTMIVIAIVILFLLRACAH